MSYDAYYATFMEQLSSYIHDWEVVLEAWCSEKIVKGDGKEQIGNDGGEIYGDTATENASCSLLMMV